MHKAKQHLARATEHVQGMERKKLIAWCCAVIAAAVLAITIVVALMVKTQAPTSITGDIVVSGEITCLPHKGDGPHTLECSYGLRTDDDRYYGLKDSPQPTTDFAIGSRVQVRGTLHTPINDAYNVVGNIKVSQITR